MGIYGDVIAAGYLPEQIREEHSHPGREGRELMRKGGGLEFGRSRVRHYVCRTRGGGTRSR